MERTSGMFTPIPRALVAITTRHFPSTSNREEKTNSLILSGLLLWYIATTGIKVSQLLEPPFTSSNSKFPQSFRERQYIIVYGICDVFASWSTSHWKVSCSSSTFLTKYVMFFLSGDCLTCFVLVMWRSLIILLRTFLLAVAVRHMNGALTKLRRLPSLL